MKDKGKLAPLLRAFKNGDVTFDYAMDFILHIFSVSKRFNSNSFLIGMMVGGILGIISLWIFL
jgi:hypothetical protein